jgi:hypothetical protein
MIARVKPRSYERPMLTAIKETVVGQAHRLPGERSASGALALQ